MTQRVEPPEHLLAAVRTLCLALPEVVEQPAYVGTRWRIRSNSFAHLYGLTEPTECTVLTFKSAGEELEMLRNQGHPFYGADWDYNEIALVLADDTDWDEVRELLVESYCRMAPKKLAALLDRPQS